AGLDSGENRNPTGVAKLQRAPRVARVEHVLDDDAFRVTFRELHRELTVDAGEATGKGIACGGNDCSAGHQVMSATVRLHASVTGALGAGIDAEHSHAREASISFSSMSKLAQTCCTSSWSSRASISFSMTCASLP